MSIDFPSPDVFSGRFAYLLQEDGFSSLRQDRFMRPWNTFHNEHKMAEEQKEQMRKLEQC